VRLLFHIQCIISFCVPQRDLQKVNVRNTNYLASDFAYENDDLTNGSLIIGFQEG